MAKHRLSLIPALLLVAQFAHAVEPAAAAAVSDGDSPWHQLQDAQGLVTNFPAWSRAELARKLVALRGNLRERAAELDSAEEESRFDVKDAVITAVLPGGLLYAAFRAQQHHQIQDRQQRVAEQVQDLKKDLVAFGVIPGASLIAAAH